MKPARAIAMLDKQVSKHGQTVELRRVVPNAPAIEATVRGFVRGFKPDEMTDDIKQGTSLLVLSPSALFGTVFATDLPRAGDKASFSGRSNKQIEMVEQVIIDDQLVRLNCTVTG